MVSNGTITYQNIHRSVNCCSLSFLEAVQALFLQRARHDTARHRSAKKPVVWLFCPSVSSHGVSSCEVRNSSSNPLLCPHGLTPPLTLCCGMIDDVTKRRVLGFPACWLISCFNSTQNTFGLIVVSIVSSRLTHYLIRIWEICKRFLAKKITVKCVDCG